MAGTGDLNIGLAVDIWLVYCFGGLIMGACWPRAWYASVAVAWLAVILVPGAIAEMLIGDESFGEGVFSTASLMFVASPFVALGAGYAGAKISQRFWRWLGYGKA